MREIRVFANMAIVGARSNRKTPRGFKPPNRYRMQLIARGGGTLMYESSVCETEQEAVRFAKQYLRRNTHLVDTTDPQHTGSGWRALWQTIDVGRPPDVIVYRDRVYRRDVVASPLEGDRRVVDPL